MAGGIRASAVLSAGDLLKGIFFVRTGPKILVQEIERLLWIRSGHLSGESAAILDSHDFIEKGFQFKTLMHGSLLHECFNITSNDHTV